MSKVLHISHTDINYDSRILKEMESLSVAGYDVAGIGVLGNENVKSTDTVLTISTIKLFSKQLTFFFRGIKHFFSLIELTIKLVFRAVRFKPNVVHCHDILVLPLGAIVKLFTGAKLVYDAHELESNKNGLSKTLSKLTLLVEKTLWGFVDRLIVVSPSIDKWYQLNVGEKETTIILNSPVIKDDKVFNHSNYFRDKFAIATDSKIFLYVGGLGKGRGIDLIIKAFKGTNLKASLIFLGHGGWSDRLKKLAKRHPNIYDHDAVPHDQVVSITRSADIGLCLIQNVSLSDYYCLPNKLFEYCFASLPVLASNFPDISKTVKKYGLGKCCNLDVDSIFNAIQEFEAMDELPMVSVENLYELSWTAQEQKLIGLYRNLLKEK